jgi:hypothetical protein
MIKPVVHYSGVITIREWSGSEEDNLVYIAYLPRVWNHPKLGVCMDVRTSGILTFPDNKGTFETLNTIYEKINPPFTAYMMDQNETIEDN